MVGTSAILRLEDFKSARARESVAGVRARIGFFAITPPLNRANRFGN
jgi:hypothetical protein